MPTKTQWNFFFSKCSKGRVSQMYLHPLRSDEQMQCHTGLTREWRARAPRKPSAFDGTGVGERCLSFPTVSGAAGGSPQVSNTAPTVSLGGGVWSE